MLAIPDDLGPGPAPAGTTAALGAIADGLDGPSGVPKKTAANLLVGTWNIAAFGGLAKGRWETGRNDSPKRNLTNLCCIAEVISRFDVCAIQETKPELTALRMLARALGPDWSFIVSDVTLGDPGNYERLSFVYDRRRIKASGLVGEVVIPKEELGVKGSLDRQFARTPYAVSFTAGTKGFTLVTLHVLYGETKAEKQRRAKELAKIAEWLDARANEPDEFNRNLIALGDFNIDRRDDPYWLAFASTGLGAPIPLQEARRNIAASSGGTDKYYDQIAWFQDGNLAKLTLEYNAAGSFLWTDYILQGMTNPSKKARISDHYPLWVEFRRN